MQPADTLSAAAFIVAAVYLFFRYRTTVGAMYAAILAFVGLGTAYYHARLDFVGQTVDVLGMYLLVSFVILMNLFGSRIRRFVLYFLLLNALMLGLIISFPGIRRYIFIGLLLLLLWTLFDRGAVRKDVYIGLGVMTAGSIAWVLDITGIWCNPGSIIQGHALWHVLCALAAVCLFRALWHSQIIGSHDLT